MDNLKRNILKRYSDLDYDSFVGLMGRRDAGKSPTDLILKCVEEVIRVNNTSLNTNTKMR